MKTLSLPAARQWRGVFFDGPFADQNADGDEIPAWSVFVGDEDAQPVDKVYTCHNFYAAAALAKRIARDRHLELISEAMPD